MKRIALAAVLIAGCASSPRPELAEPPPSLPPRLVLVISVDQLRADRLDPRLPGGLGRLAREGRVFADAAHAHSDTETCPGHAVLLTGRHPGAVGVPANDWIDRASGRSRYCVEDDAPDAAVLGAPLPEPGDAPTGRSPRLLRVDALGDWLRAAHPGARVFSVSGKDRAAIAMAGRRPDGAYWLDSKGALGFTTSAYYQPALPEWARAWHGENAAWLAAVPDQWEHATGAPPNGARPDPTAGEVTRYSHTSPHPVRDAELRTFLGRLLFTPFLDDLTLGFARALFEAESLGRDETVDLLAIGLSATDYVGHFYGPGSQEARDALLRLDAALGRFLEAVDAAVGPGRTLVVLSADHGVLELPEWLAATGASECPLPAGRGDAKALLGAVAADLTKRFGPPPAPHAKWLLESGYSLTVNRAAAAAARVAPERIAAAAQGALATQPGVARVWKAEEIARGEGPEPFASLYRRSFDSERSGDLVVQPVSTCLLSEYPQGTSHGSPYGYDRAVPVVFAGPGVAPGVVRGPVAPVDIAPTLARRLGIPAPAGLDGRPLPLD